MEANRRRAERVTAVFKGLSLVVCTIKERYKISTQNGFLEMFCSVIFLNL